MHGSISMGDESNMIGITDLTGYKPVNAESPIGLVRWSDDSHAFLSIVRSLCNLEAAVLSSPDHKASVVVPSKMRGIRLSHYASLLRAFDFGEGLAWCRSLIHIGLSALMICSTEL